MFNWFKRSSKSEAEERPLQRKDQRLREPVWELRGSVPEGPAGRLPPRRPAANAGAAADGFAGERTTPVPAGLAAGAKQLSSHAQRILARLPPEAGLDRTCEGFPHVVESLLRHWSDHAAFRRTLDALMIDSRGNRQGFPFDVMMELSALREYYNVTVDPLKSAGWDVTDVR